MNTRINTAFNFYFSPASYAPGEKPAICSVCGTPIAEGQPVHLNALDPRYIAHSIHHTKKLAQSSAQSQHGGKL